MGELIIFNTADKSSFSVELYKAKERVEQRRERLTLHCTMTAATLIGIVAVFGDIRSFEIPLWCLTGFGVLFLCLSALSGVWYCARRIRLTFLSLEKTAERYLKEDPQGDELIPAPKPFVMLARTCPIFLCFGVLLLSACVIAGIFL